MNLELRLYELTIAGIANPLFHLWPFLRSDSVSKFLKAFFPAFLSTGVILGILYVLVMRGINVDRKHVEEWCENLRLRLQAGPVPIMEWAQPAMVGALLAIYGRSASRRLTSSFLVGLFFASAVFGSMYLRSKNASVSLREEKAQLERDVDPKLYSYATDPRLKSEYDKAWQQKMVRIGPDDADIRYVYEHGIYDELRNRHSDFQRHLVQRLFTNPARVKLTPLFLMEGTYLDPGFQWAHSIFLFLFTVLLDFVSVTMVMAALRSLDPKASFRKAISSFLRILAGTLICATAAFLSYRLFFRGDTGFFFQLLLVFPLSVGATLSGLGGLILFFVSLFRNELERDSWGGLVQFVFLSFLGISGLRYVSSYWHPLSLGLISLREAFSFPYILPPQPSFLLFSR